VTVFPPVTGSPLEPEKPRFPPVRGFSMRKSVRSDFGLKNVQKKEAPAPPHRDATPGVSRVASAYCLQQVEKCREEAARATDDDIRAYWKEAGRCWLALAQHGEARPWPFVSRQSDHVTVLVQDGDIVVSAAGFYAVYYKPCNQPQLILRRRTDTDDHGLLARAWQAANDKARELGWIV
jgi:hypothetical protein